MDREQTKEILLNAATALESPITGWSPNAVAKLRNIAEEIEQKDKSINLLSRALRQIVREGELWGSEGKRHHDAIYKAKCALIITEGNETETHNRTT
jgi:hypothetical protein